MYGLIFDMDGVLANTESLTAQATIRVLAERFGRHDVKVEDFAEGVGRGAEAYIRAGAGKHRLELNDEQMAEAVRLREENLLNLVLEHGAPSFPGVRELVQDSLGSQRFRTAVATSSARRVAQAVLASIGVPLALLQLITGDDVTRKKPDPAIFLLAAERLRLEPKACLVIEDSVGGVQAAKAASMACIAVTSSFPRARLTQADLVVDSLAEVSLDRVAALIDHR